MAVLDAAEIAQVQSTVTQYNAVIAQQVTAARDIPIDMHTYFKDLAQSGITINNYHGDYRISRRSLRP